jgi:hypothetical protein
VFPAQAGIGSPDGRALSITLTSMPDKAADFRASAMLASGMKYGDCRKTCRCAVTIIENSPERVQSERSGQDRAEIAHGFRLLGIIRETDLRKLRTRCR